ncbi:CoA pyrophosphatase [Litoribacillus peritrichatus]|uniref:Nudix hydrolase domain-containing protein n=1 Tax=Litoribacillus peritrichatus TaxID=718191 RepID=A0ABP7M4Q3_9GAMM
MSQEFSAQNMRDGLQNYPYKKHPISPANQASVAIIFRETASHKLEVLMIQRSVNEQDPWSGHMAFPGGKKSTRDQNSLTTAIRETTEETGIQLSKHQCLGRLSDVLTRTHSRKKLMKIKPWVFFIAANDPMKTNIRLNHEAEQYYWLPCSLFTQHNRTHFHWPLIAIGQFKYSIRLPSYVFKKNKIWGLSLMMIDELCHIIQHQGKRKFSFRKKLRLYFF